MHTLSYWLALRQIAGLDWQWLQRDFLPYHSLDQLFAEPENHALTPTLCQRLRGIDWSCVDEELDWQAAPQQHRITLADASYPESLRHIDTPPPVLYVEGQLNALLSPQIAIVGTRHPSYAGTQTTQQLAAHLAKQGLSITSGLAYGIDAAAHQGTLAVNGQTLAVMGTGISHRYPKQHDILAARIAETGALISELPPHALPLARHFPARNRIITGLSMGVIVVEAALQSGSLISARLANEQGRLVMAVPGSIHNPQTQGCHWLLKQGAILVTSAEDVLAELPAHFNQLVKKTSKIPPIDLAKPPSNMVQYLSLEPRSIEDIILLSGKTTSVVQTELTLLVLSGHAQQIAGGYVSTYPGIDRQAQD